MTFSEPNPDVKRTGEEPAEYVEDATGGPPPASADPTGEAHNGDEGRDA
jgi:hypothetical protein